MSITKRIWVELDPDYADARKQFHDKLFEDAEAFSYRLPGTKFELATNGKRRRNPWWSWAVNRVLKEVAVEVIRINGGIFFRTQAERDRVKELADRYVVEGPETLRGQATQKSLDDYRASRFAAALQGINTTADAEKRKAKLAHKDCPDCGYPMKIRTARKGPNAGVRFLGCRYYPSCKGTRPIKTQTRAQHTKRLEVEGSTPTSACS